jgi:hypothetical protein
VTGPLAQEPPNRPEPADLDEGRLPELSVVNLNIVSLSDKSERDGYGPGLKGPAQPATAEIVGNPAATDVYTVCRRRWPVLVVMIAAMLLSGCHVNPYRWPRPGQPGAAPLEKELSKRDSLQDAAKELIAVAAAVRDAVQRAYPATQWAPTSDGSKSNCAPPFIFLTGSTYILPVWRSVAPSSESDVRTAVAAAAGVLKAHHAEQVDPNPGRSVGGALPRDRGELEFDVMEPPASNSANSPNPPEMIISGVTGCHHIAPGPGPWDVPAITAPPPPGPENAPAPPLGPEKILAPPPAPEDTPAPPPAP